MMATIQSNWSVSVNSADRHFMSFMQSDLL